MMYSKVKSQFVVAVIGLGLLLLPQAEAANTTQIQGSESDPALVQAPAGTSTSASKQKAEDDPVAVQEVEEENETAVPTNAPATDGGGSTATATDAPATDGFTPSSGHSEQLEGTTAQPTDTVTEPVSNSGTSTSMPTQEVDASIKHNQQLEETSATTIDDDEDGFTEEAGDCDDANAAVHPGASEICDSIDNDCNTAIDDNCVAANPTDDPNDADPNITQTSDATETATGASSTPETATTPPPSEDANLPTTEPEVEGGTDEVDDVPDETASADSDEDGGCSLTPF